MIPSFVDDAVRSAQKFHQLFGHVQAGVESAVRHGRQIRSIVNQASEFLSSVDWPAVREPFEELQRANEAEFETEIQSTVDEVCREAVEDGDDLVAILQRLHFQNDEPKMGRRDAIVDSVKSVAQNVVGTVIGGLILKELIDATRQAFDKPPSNVGQQPQRKAHRAKPNRGDPNRGTPNRAEPNRVKPNDGKPTDEPVKATKPKQGKA